MQDAERRKSMWKRIKAKLPFRRTFRTWRKRVENNDDVDYTIEVEMNVQVKFPLWIQKELRKKNISNEKIEKLGRKIARIQTEDFEHMWKKRCEIVKEKGKTRNDIWRDYLTEVDFSTIEEEKKKKKENKTKFFTVSRKKEMSTEKGKKEKKEERSVVHLSKRGRRTHSE